MIALFAVAFVSMASAQEAETRATSLAPVQVFGDNADSLDQPLAPEKVSAERLKTYQFTDVNRALKQTSGVYVREEDGQGLRPNIGLRGTDPDRSKKIVLMEDGVLAGPAPYSAPAAYYSPSMNRVESLEVYKGFEATGIGPNSVGGSVNYVTPPIPFAPEYKVRAMGGSYSTLNTVVSAGGPASFGGYYINGSRLDSEGFKKIDGGGDAGFSKNDMLGKLRIKLPRSGGKTHRLDVKLGYGDEVSNETYLGLTQSDFDNSPYRRYASTALDQMRWTHRDYQLSHAIQVGKTGVVETTAYRRDFHRVWYRFDRFRNSAIDAQNVLSQPTGGNQAYYDILRGARDSSSLGAGGELVHARNDREFVSQGVQSRLSIAGSIGAFDFEPEIMARYHADKVDRHHTSDRYQMVSGREIRTADPTQTDAINQDSAQAWSFVAQSQIKRGPFVLTPILRYETAQLEFSDSLAGRRLSRNDHAWVPGVSFLWKFRDRFSARASVNRGVTMAGLASDGKEAKEDATNYEFEFKYVDPVHSLEAGVTAFRSDYKNLTGVCAGAEGCSNSQTDTVFNGGKADVSGLESRVAKDFRAGSLHFPVQGALTVLRAIHASDFDSQSPEWGVGTIRSGDPLPYVPAAQYTLSVGSEWRRFKQDFSIIYQGRVYDQSLQANRNEIPGYGIVDWAASYQVSRPARIVARIDNLFAKEYAVSNRPFGFRSGKPQSFNVGFIYQF